MVILSISSNSNAWLLPAYVVQRASGLLPNEALHANLVAGDLHIPMVHDSAFHTNQVRRLWIPARLWEAGVIVGSARGNVGDTPVWAIPDGAAEQLLAFLRPPVGADMETIALRLYLATDVNNMAAGICQMVSEMTGYAEGDAITAMGGGVSQDIDMPNSGAGISILEISQDLAYTAGVPPYDYYALMLTRRGDLGGDTYGGTVNVIGMEVSFDFES